MDLPFGRYRHNKSGKTYRIIGVAKHSETLADMVIYRGEYYHEEFGNEPLFTRPIELFTDEVTLEGKKCHDSVIFLNKHPGHYSLEVMCAYDNLFWPNIPICLKQTHHSIIFKILFIDLKRKIYYLPD